MSAFDTIHNALSDQHRTAVEQTRAILQALADAGYRVEPNDRLRQLAAWWRRCQGDDSFRHALNFCAGQLELALDGELSGFETTTLYQGGKSPRGLDR